MRGPTSIVVAGTTLEATDVDQLADAYSSTKKLNGEAIGPTSPDNDEVFIVENKCTKVQKKVSSFWFICHDYYFPLLLITSIFFFLSRNLPMTCNPLFVV